ncbi:MAG: pyridoxal phosphate-dependent aminotransferase [Gammaproteobacteria bacterium]|jgi:aspartate/methionine/tyrosine aminotransferase|nr:pyridoxal phosphate-dependent aminotransferase [Gammaproteobacteria bacterium]
MKHSLRLDAVQNPIIPYVGKLTKENAGTISFGQGIAFYNPPPHAFRKVQQCLADASINRYGPVEGIPELQHALAQKLKSTNNIDFNANNSLVVTAGSNMAFNTAILAITDPGDEVILPLPYYFNHEMSLVMEQCKPILVPTDDLFHLQLDKLEAAITKKTKAIITISPNNPSGAVYTKNELIAVNELCRQNNIYHITDEAYEDFYYDDRKHFSIASEPNTNEYTISLFSFSKGFGFAGWRIGYMVIPEHLLSTVKKIQDTILISPPMISQHAAIGALKAGESFIQSKRNAMSQKRKMVLQALTNLSCLKNAPSSEGAFYALLNIDTQMDDIHLVKMLIEKYRVATIPGSAFGLHGNCYLRLSYGALSDQDIATGMDRLLEGIAKCI